MSHWTTIQTQIKDMAALGAACRELGIQLCQGNMAEARGYGSTTRKGDYVIRLKGPYDVALTKSANGNYDMATDWWDGHVAKEVGQDFKRLTQLYGVHKAMIEARRKGWTVHRTQRGEEVQLTISGVK